MRLHHLTATAIALGLCAPILGGSCPEPDPIVDPDATYFVVGSIVGAQPSQDSYIVKLADPDDIQHARDLIEHGPGVGQTIIYASIEPCADGINRNTIAQDQPLWSWQVEFIAFADATIELIDGSPTLVEDDVEWWMANTGGFIGFWNYTVIDELAPEEVLPPGDVPADLNGDGVVNAADLALLLGAWGSCAPPCPVDLNGDLVINAADLALLLGAWTGTS